MNAVIPIARLPPELLAQIFVAYIAAMKGYSSYRHRGSSHYYWVEVTHVCHHWREVALNTPKLWSDILIESGCGSVERVQTFIARSKQAALHIAVLSTKEKWYPTLQEVLREIHRAETLKLKLGRDVLSVAMNHLPSKAPHLRLLDIQTPYNSTPSDYVVFPLGKCAAPSLTDLTISSHRVNWAKGIFPQSLARLYISGGAQNTSLCKDVVEALDGLPALEYLQLIDVLSPFPESTTSLPPTFSPVCFAKMKDLRIASSALISVYFLAHCVVPASTKITLTIQSSCSAEAVPLMIAPLSSKLNEGLIADGKQAVNSVVISSSCMTFYKREAAPVTTDRMQPHFILNLPVGMRDGLILGSLYPHLPLRDVATLSIANITYHQWAKPGWLKMLEAMENLQALTFVGDSLSTVTLNSLLRARTTSTDAEPDPKRPHLMPKLKQIALRRYRFREADDDDEETTFVNELRKTLSLRKASGSRIRRVVVKECINMDEGDIKVLQKSVAVIWDGVVDYEDIDDEDEFYESDPDYSSYYDDYGYGRRHSG